MRRLFSFAETCLEYNTNMYICSATFHDFCINLTAVFLVTITFEDMIKTQPKPNTLIITLASTRAIIKVSGHQHQWFPGVSQVVTM